MAATRNVGGAIKDNDVKRRRSYMPSVRPEWNAKPNRTTRWDGGGITWISLYQASRPNVLILCCSSVIVFSKRKI